MVVVVVLIIRYRLEVGSGGVEQKWMCIMYNLSLRIVHGPIVHGLRSKHLIHTHTHCPPTYVTSYCTLTCLL